MIRVPWVKVGGVVVLASYPLETFIVFESIIFAASREDTADLVRPAA